MEEQLQEEEEDLRAHKAIHALFVEIVTKAAYFAIANEDDVSKAMFDAHEVNRALTERIRGEFDAAAVTDAYAAATTRLLPCITFDKGFILQSVRWERSCVLPPLLSTSFAANSPPATDFVVQITDVKHALGPGEFIRYDVIGRHIHDMVMEALTESGKTKCTSSEMTL